MIWALLAGLLILFYIFLLLLVVASFGVPLSVWVRNNSPKPKNFREILRFAWKLFYILLFPWLLMYGGVRYFYELLWDPRF